MSVTITRPARRRPVFHPLPVTAVDRLTDDALAITFTVPDELRGTFAFQAGQHLTVRRDEDGEDVRRSYSICSTPGELAASGRLRIGVKQIVGGAFSGYAAGALRVGHTIDVLPPLGHFTTDFAPDRERRYAALVAGSGITPVLSLVATGLATEPASRFTVVYGNRSARSVMFSEELADLKDRYLARLHLVHVLSREPGNAALLSGRLDATRVATLLDVLIDAAGVDEWFLCGPYGMVLDAQQVLTDRGVPQHRVHTELFHVDESPPPAGPGPTPTGSPGSPRVAGSGPTPPAGGLTDGAGMDTVTLTVIVDGRATTTEMARDERVLDAALRARPDLPYSCRGGVCSTCRARLVEGEVTMARNYALEPDELASNHILTCQSTPLTPRLTITYDP